MDVRVKIRRCDSKSGREHARVQAAAPDSDDEVGVADGQWTRPVDGVRTAQGVPLLAGQLAVRPLALAPLAESQPELFQACVAPFCKAYRHATFKRTV
jgi:hypothetical protein